MAFPALDLSAVLHGFLLHAYIAAFGDPRRHPDDRLHAQLDLEAFLLRHGPPILLYVQRGFNVGETDAAAEATVAEWFLQFVGSRPEEWLRATNLSTIERFWRQVPDPRIAQAAVDRIIQVEFVNDPFGGAAHGSLLVSLFREAQPALLTAPLSDRAAIIVEGLLARTRLTPVPTITGVQSHIARYALRVLRYCYKDQYQSLSPFVLDAIVALGGDMTDEVRQLVYSELSH
jgi:hypothetical protein